MSTEPTASEAYQPASTEAVILSKWTPTDHGKPCPKCKGTLRVEHHGKGWTPKRVRQNYYFLAWLRCTHCKTMFMIESSKTFIVHDSPTVASGTHTQLPLSPASF